MTSYRDYLDRQGVARGPWVQREGRVPSEPGSREPSPTVSALSGFDPSRFGGPYAIPWPPEGCRLHLNLIRRPKGFGLWWSLIDAEGGWFDGGHVSTHRTKAAAQKKARLVGDYLASRDRDASLAEDAKRLSGEAVAAQAAESGIAQGDQP